MYFNHISAFTSSDINKFVYPFIHDGPSIDLFMILMNTLEAVGSRNYSDKISNSKKLNHLKFIEQLLDLFFSDVKRCRYHDLIIDIIFLKSSNQSFLWNNILIYLASLPDRILKYLRENTSSFFYPNQYFNRIIKLTYLLIEKDSFVNHNGQNIKFNWNNLLARDSLLIQLFNKISNVGKSNYIVNHMVDIISLLPENQTWCKKLKMIFEGLNTIHFEKIFVNLLQQQKVVVNPKLPNILCDLIGDLFRSSSTIQLLLTTKLFSTYELHLNVLLSLVQFFYLSTKSAKEQRFVNIMLYLIDLFGNKNFIDTSSYRIHKNLTKSIVFGLQYISKQELEETLLSSLISAVQEHMNLQFPSLRKLGMIIGEKFSSIVSPSEPIKFEYDEDEYEQEDNEIFITEDTNDVEEEKGKDESILNIDDPYVLSFIDISDSDSDDEFTPLNLEDNLDDLKSFKTPVYLRECVVGLRSDEPEAVETTLNVLEKIINSKPDGIDEVSETLASCLLHLEDKFELKDFHTLKLNSLTALVTHSTQPTVKYLTYQFFQPNFSLQQRLDMLEALERGAKRLASLQKEEQSKVQEIMLREKPTFVEQKNIIRAPKPRKKLESSKNLFAMNADLFIYGLIGDERVWKTSYISKMDPMILGKLCFVLGVFIECSGILNPRLAQGTKTILDFIWSIRYHENAFVRRSVFLTLQIIIKVVPPYILLVPPIVDDITEIYQWSEDQHKNDTDDECRKLALHILFSLSKIFKENQQYQIPVN